MQTDIDNLRAAVEPYDVTEAFIPSTGPSGFGANEYYPSHEEYPGGVAEAMREEYSRSSTPGSSSRSTIRS